MNPNNIKKKLSHLKVDFYSHYNSTNHKCFFSNCENQSIKSHSLSESSVLALLEGTGDSKAMILYHLQDHIDFDFDNDLTMSTYQSAKRRLDSKGKGDSSTFYGFCKTCDAETFKLIDNYPYLNADEINFLHALRTFAHYITRQKQVHDYTNKKVIPGLKEIEEKRHIIPEGFATLNEIFQKIPDDYLLERDLVKEMAKNYHDNNDIPIKNERFKFEEFFQDISGRLFNLNDFPMSGMDFKKRLNIFMNEANDALKELHFEDNDFLELAVDAVLTDLNNSAKLFTKYYYDKVYNSFEYLNINISGFFPIAGAFVFKIEDQEIALTFFPEKTGKTQFLFALAKQDTNSIFFSKLKLMNDLQVTKQITNIILSQATNVYFSPRYWNKLPNEIKDLLVSDKQILLQTKFNLFDKEYEEVPPIVQ